jgi:hypothetical protein
MRIALSKLFVSARHGALKLHRSGYFGEVSIASRTPQPFMKAQLSVTGTALAISYLSSGVAAHSRRTTRRGGARNRASRETYSLTDAHVANLLAASSHAADIGLPFTRMVTIHWEAAGVPVEVMPRATGRFIDLMAKTLARHGCRTAWLWTHENGDNKGGHCHLLVHVPATLVPVLTCLQKGWLRRITGAPYRSRVIRSRPIGGRLGLETGHPALHAINLQTALSYILKGASQLAAARYGLERWEPGGRVVGKRCGTSQNIGAKARKTGVST